MKISKGVIFDGAVSRPAGSLTGTGAPGGAVNHGRRRAFWPGFRSTRILKARRTVRRVRLLPHIAVSSTVLCIRVGNLPVGKIKFLPSYQSLTAPKHAALVGPPATVKA